MANVGFNTALSNMANSVFGYSRTSDRNFGSGTASMNSSIDSYLGGGGNSLSSMFGGYTPAHRGGLFGSSNDIIGKLVGSIPTPQTIDYSAAFLQGGALFGGGGQIAATGSQQQGKIGCHEIPRAGGNGTELNASDGADPFDDENDAKRKSRELTSDHVENTIDALMEAGFSEAEASAMAEQAEEAADGSRPKFDKTIKELGLIPSRAPTKEELEKAGSPEEKAKLIESREAKWQDEYGRWYAKNVGGLTDRQAEEFVKREMFGVADTVKGTREADVKRSPYPGTGLYRYADDAGNHFFYSKSKDAWFNDKDGKEPIKVKVTSGKPNPTAKGGNPLKIVSEGGEIIAKDDALQIARTGLQEANGKLYDSFKISEANGSKAQAILGKAGDQDILHDSATNGWFTWSRKDGEAPVEMAPRPVGRSPNGQFLVFEEAKRTRPIHDGVGIADMRKKVDVAMNQFKADLKRVSEENAASRKERIERFEASWKDLPEEITSAVKYEKDGEDFSFTVDAAGAAKLKELLKDKNNSEEFNSVFGKLPGDIQVKLNGAVIRLRNGATGEFNWRISQMPKEGAEKAEDQNKEAKKPEAEKLENPEAENKDAQKLENKNKEAEKTEAKKQEAENKEAQKQEAKKQENEKVMKQEPGTQENAKADVRVFVVNLSHLDAEAAKKKMIDAVSKKANSGDIGTINFKEIDLGENCKITKKEFEKILGEVAKEFGVEVKDINYKTVKSFKPDAVAEAKREAGGSRNFPEASTPAARGVEAKVAAPKKKPGIQSNSSVAEKARYDRNKATLAKSQNPSVDNASIKQGAWAYSYAVKDSGGVEVAKVDFSLPKEFDDKLSAALPQVLKGAKGEGERVARIASWLLGETRGWKALKYNEDLSLKSVIRNRHGNCTERTSLLYATMSRAKELLAGSEGNIDNSTFGFAQVQGVGEPHVCLTAKSGGGKVRFFDIAKADKGVAPEYKDTVSLTRAEYMGVLLSNKAQEVCDFVRHAIPPKPWPLTDGRRQANPKLVALLDRSVMLAGKNADVLAVAGGIYNRIMNEFKPGREKQEFASKALDCFTRAKKQGWFADQNAGQVISALERIAGRS